MIRAFLRRLAALGLSAGLMAVSASNGHSSGSVGPTVTIVATPGYAFVYAQVDDSSSSYPAPSGLGHQSPYYATWTRQPFGAGSCPWIWVVYVFNRATNQQVNALPPSAPQPNFGTATWFCASPSATPVEEPPVTEASARLDLDLRVALSPSRPTAGAAAVLSARLTSSLTQDLNLYLNMAITDWSISSWSVDFGDGSGAALPGRGSITLDLPHTYSSAGNFDARVVASIAGHAEAAKYDRYGDVSLIREPFSVEIGNDTLATASAPPARTYLPPQVEVRVSPAIDALPDPNASLRHVEVMRGALTTFSLHLIVIREALIRSGTAQVGTGRSRLIRWSYDGPASEAPPGSGTVPGQLQEAGAPLRLQWNEPDRISAKQLQDYAIPLTLYVETRFQDGHVVQYVLHSTFSVTVDFTAQSG
jgi:hypothetical protein